MNIFINRENRIRAGWRLFLQLILMYFIMILTAFVPHLLLPSSLILSMVIPQFLGTVGSVWFMARFVDKRSFASYGVDINRRWVKEFLSGSGIAAAAIGFIFLLEWWAGWLTITGYEWEPATESGLPFWVSLSSFFIAMLLVGFHEELFSRGYQTLNLTEGLRFPLLGTRGSVALAVLLTSSLFGFLHLNNPNASALSTVNIILAGVVLVIPFILTESLALSAGLHFGWNFTMGGILGFPVSGLNVESSVFLIGQGGTELWTGGAFGPEAGLAGILGMAIMAGGSYVYMLKAGYEMTIANVFKEKYSAYAKSDEQAH